MKSNWSKIQPIFSKKTVKPQEIVKQKVDKQRFLWPNKGFYGQTKVGQTKVLMAKQRVTKHRFNKRLNN